MFDKQSVRHLLVAAVASAMLVAGPARGQETKKGGSVPITFVPPPMENATYSVGIYEVKSGKLARRLCEAAGQDTFKIGLNGLITSWDGKDDDGKPLPPGKYAARGYAVGPLAVEGVALHDNDWVQEDEDLRICAVEGLTWIPADDGFCAVALMVGDKREVIRFSKEGKVLWRRALALKASPKTNDSLPWRLVPHETLIDVFAVGADGRASFRLADGSAGPVPVNAPGPAGKKMVVRIPGDTDIPSSVSEGRDHTFWAIDHRGLFQVAASGEALRALPNEKISRPGPPPPPDGSRDFVPASEWQPFVVSASTNSEVVYLLEATTYVPQAIRLRGIRLTETKDEDTKRVSTWQTFIQRAIQASGIALEAEGKSEQVGIILEENPLQPGKRQRIELTGTFDAKGSYLSTADGLRLRQIGQRSHLGAVDLTLNKVTTGLTFMQTDGAAWDEFSIKGAQKMLGFDAGEFEIDAAGEKPMAEKAPEPDL